MDTTDYFTNGQPQHNGWHGRAVYDPDQRPGRILVTELLRYEHELSLPHDEYVDLFLEEVTR